MDKAYLEQLLAQAGETAILALAMVIFYLTSFYSYVLFHSLIEIGSIIVGACVFLIAWNSRRYYENNYILVLGISYLFTALIDFIHLLAYKGMSVFIGYDANLPTQLWVFARAIQALTLLAAPALITRKVHEGAVFSIYMIVALIGLWSIFAGYFPATYLEDGNGGLTAFKIISEYAIILVLAAAAFHLYTYRTIFDRGVHRLLMWAILATMMSEFCFTTYISVYDLSNLVGHFFKLISIYLIYKAVIVIILHKPYSLLFRGLRRR